MAHFHDMTTVSLSEWHISSEVIKTLEMSHSFASHSQFPPCWWVIAQCLCGISFIVFFEEGIDGLIICSPTDPFTDLRAVQISVFQYLYKSSELQRTMRVLLWSSAALSLWFKMNTQKCVLCHLPQTNYSWLLLLTFNDLHEPALDRFCQNMTWHSLIRCYLSRGAQWQQVSGCLQSQISFYF